MAKTYVLDMDAQTFTCGSCSFIGQTLHNNAGLTIEQVLRDLCLCMVEAIDIDDADAKQIIGYAMHLILGTVVG